MASSHSGPCEWFLARDHGGFWNWLLGLAHDVIWWLVPNNLETHLTCRGGSGWVVVLFLATLAVFCLVAVGLLSTLYVFVTGMASRRAEERHRPR